MAKRALALINKSKNMMLASLQSNIVFLHRSIRNFVKKILVLCPYPENCAPSQRLKYEQYFDSFRQAGYQVKTSSFVNKRFWKIIYKHGLWLSKACFTFTGYVKRIYDLFRIRRFDVVYIHLWVTPLGLPVFEWLVRLLARSVIYDIDDMIFLGHSSNANRLLQGLKGRKKIIFLMKSSDSVITSTPALETFARNHNKNVTDIPATLNTCGFDAKTEYSIQGSVVLGYSGSHSTSKYLHSIEPAFEKLLQIKTFEFVVFVVGDSRFRFSNPDIPVEAKDWTLADEHADLMRMDIGLYPLTDEPWVYGKRGGKALLYMGAGLPVIATAIGTNFDTFQDGENGFLVGVTDMEDWVSKIVMLAHDENLRRKTGVAAREALEKNFSVEANKDKYLKVIASITKRKDR
ncbi:MAG: glycosyltransferase [Bacteroidetes bacterium HGW-Bacteroidetes-6]|nr:MAG: glycosyltransferase [Bacteroidetes bacterium HGW-Bacteroidetes-6]